MRNQRFRFLRFFVFAAGFLLLWSATASAQNAVPETRITEAVDNAELTLLKGNVHSMARPKFDRGAAGLNLPMERMTLVLRATTEQQATLATLLDEQQDQSSPNYHKWLTPTQFGQQFGASEQDIQTITSWLQSQGFQVNHVANGRNAIEFSGTAGQVQQAFHTAIHKYSIPNAAGVSEDHWANSADPQIPAALAPVVVGMATLHNFLKAPQHILSPEKFTFANEPGKTPQFTSSTGLHAIGPGDLAVIYNAAPLFAATPAINGTGSTVAVVARSNIFVEDLNDFRTTFGITGPFPFFVLNGPDPGNLGGGEELEAVLDASYSSALAQQATVQFVISASTNTADGVDLSERYIIDNNVGDVMTESFGGCEQGVTSGEAANISNLAQQAAAQGITYLVSTGDNGSAGCDDPNSSAATQGVSVNVLASTPYTVGVGGTMFNDMVSPTTYWNATNSSVLASAKNYIPENVWNQSCSNPSCPPNTLPNLAAGSGGVSTLFAQPSWQSGVAGIPAPPNKRDLPDVSLTAAGHDPYLVCFEGSCSQHELEGVAGTSASVQAFGGIMALVRQKVGARVGQADYVFYKLAATETLANCNGSKATPVPATNCIFYDTTVGNNAVPGIPNFGNSNADYQTTVGYDLASGLGSVNIANLVNQWSSVSFAPTSTTLTVTPTTFTHGAAATFNITVAPKIGTPAFTNEEVSLVPSTGPIVGDFPLSSGGTVSGMTNTIPGGSTTVAAHYPGNGTLGSSDSAPVTLTVAPEASTTVTTALTGSSPTSLVPFTTAAYGAPIFIQGKVAGNSGFGVPTGAVIFKDQTTGFGAGSTELDTTGTGLSANVTLNLFGGTHVITTIYEGDASFKGNTGANITLTITPAPTTLALQSLTSSPLAGGMAVIFAQLSATSDGTFPTGTASLFNGSTLIAGPVIVQSDAEGGPIEGAQILFNLNNLPAGQMNLTAKYSGDQDYEPSTSAALAFSVLRMSTVAISSSNPSVQQGLPVTFTATLGSPQAGGPAISGSVQFSQGNANLGAPVAVANNQAQLTTSSLAVGSSPIMAAYSGDANYGSSIASVAETVTAGPDFSFSVGPSVVTVTSPGLSAMTTVTVAGSNGFSGLTTFTCMGLPAKSLCVFTPAMVTGSGTTMLTVTTTAASGFGLGARNTFNNWTATSGAIRALIFSAALFILAVQIRRRRWNFAGALIVVALLLGTAGCGGGGGGTPPPVIPGTPAGSTTVTVTATSAAITHNTTFTLTVN